MAKAKAKFELSIYALDAFTKPFEAFGNRVSEATAGIRKWGEEMEIVKKRISTALGIPQIAKSLKGLKEGFSKVGGAAKDFALRLGGLGLAGAGAVAGMYSLVRVYTDAGDEAAKAAQKAGISTAAWQEMAYAASLSDVTNEQLAGGYQKLNKAMVGAATGGKKQTAAFKQLGIAVKNSRGELKASDEVMLEVAEAFSKMPEGAQKTALAMEIFGKSGAALLPLLNGGKEGLKMTRREAEELGLVMGEEAAKGSEEFNDNITRLQARFKGLGMIVGGALLPAFSDLTAMFSGLIDENRALIRTKVAEYAEKIRAAMPKIKAVIERVVGLLPKAVGLFEKIAGWLGLGGTAAAGFGAVFGGPVLTALGGFLSMIKPIASLMVSFLGPFKLLIGFLMKFSGYVRIAGIALKMLLANPVALVLTGFAVALKLVIDHFGGFESWLQLCKDGISVFTDDCARVAKVIKDALCGAFEWLAEKLAPIGEFFRFIGESILNFLQPAIDSAMAFLKPFFDFLSSILDKISEIANPGAAIGEMVYGKNKTDEEMHSEALQKQRSEMLRKKEAGEISNEQYRNYMTSSYAQKPARGQPGAAAPGIMPSGPLALPAEGGAMAPAQETKHTEEKIEKVQMTLNLPPGVTASAPGSVSNNVSVNARASAVGMANQ